jgi:hypothetical protein
MVFSLEHDITVTKNHQNLLPTQSVLVAHTVFLISYFPRYISIVLNEKKYDKGNILLYIFVLYLYFSLIIETSSHKAWYYFLMKFF